MDEGDRCVFIVTGGCGFIGSNLVRALNDRGEDNILVVDRLTNDNRFRNLADCRIADYIDRDDFRERIRTHMNFGPVAAVLHQGACADTLERDERFMLDNNFQWTKELFAWCQSASVPLVFASSAAVYGKSGRFIESGGSELPLNVYGWSKLLFDLWLRRRLHDLHAPVVGLRYFNVYGQREDRKGRMASVVHHFDRQIRDQDAVQLFAASHGYGDGEQRRDFIFVGDVVKVNMWACGGTAPSGIYNVGTGRSRSFNDVARTVIDWHQTGAIEYIPFPKDLLSAYQPITEADLTQLRAAGYTQGFAPIEEGVKMTLDLRAQPD